MNTDKIPNPKSAFRLFLFFSYLLYVNCATVRPYKVTNYFLSPKLPERKLKRVAVLPFENLTKEEKAAKIVQEEFSLQVGKLEIFDLLERARIEELWQEQDLDTLYRFDATTAAKIGKTLGAEGVIFGSVTNFSPYPEVKKDTTQREKEVGPSVIIVDDNNSAWKWFLMGILAITVVGFIIYLVVKPSPPSAEVGVSVRLVDVETGDILWQAKDSFRGTRKSIQALVETKEDKERLVKDIEFLASLLCQKLAETLKVDR
ncbi:MAG: CsgG/HfaB family protein [candidate division WOR-3 bacterium]